jgi:hypothetical protein
MAFTKNELDNINKAAREFYEGSGVELETTKDGLVRPKAIEVNGVFIIPSILGNTVVGFSPNAQKIWDAKTRKSGTNVG